MVDTTYISGTTVTSASLNDINNHVYKSTPISPATTVHPSSVVQYTPAGTGAVATTVQSKLRESVSVKDFGAVGDGVTNDTAAIQAAHAAAVAGGFTQVLFPAGTYQFTTLVWSPHIGARTAGKVYLRTANASGRTIQISDEYGRPALYGVNSERNVIWDGQFFVINTNAGNTATAWSFGGATTENYCGWCTVLRGVETRGFNGGVYEFRNHSALITIMECFSHGNNGAQINVADPTTNSGENINFVSCIFGMNSGAANTAYLLDINTVHVWSFSFTNCSADYLAGLNKPANAAPLTSISWCGGHMEWDQVTAAYLQNDSASTWNVDGTLVGPTASSGWPTYVVSETTGSGTTRFTNIKYVIPGAVNTLHRAVSATSRVVVDYTPNYQNGNLPTTFVQYHIASVIGYDGVTIREIINDTAIVWSGTIGNGTKSSSYTRVGNRVDMYIKLVWGTTTSHGVAPQIFSLPYTVNANAGGGGTWWANDYGTAARSGTVKIVASGTALTLWDGVTATQVTEAVPMTWANMDEINIMLTFFTG